MDRRYEEFCTADRYFYDTPSRRTDDHPFAVLAKELPGDWRHSDSDHWWFFQPAGVRLPEQGWKVHVSVCPANADRVLDRVWDYCIAKRVAFKFLRDRHILLVQNSKSAHRGSSGKFVTVYPVDDAAFRDVVEDLAALLAGEPGPYILTDLRWGSGPIYVRYGGFHPLRCRDAIGDHVPAIRRPDGVLVPDDRSPGFAPPDWIGLPDFLRPQYAASRTSTIEDLPYRIDNVLQFSNGGGVYLATRRADGGQVVLKEARPLAGLDANQDDAVTRIDREEQVLRRLAGIPGIPAIYDAFSVWEHRFIAMEYVEGETLNSWSVRNQPLIHHGTTARDRADYARRVLDIVAELGRILAEVHARGIVFGDLHPGNVLMDPETGALTLIDFEAAFDIGSGKRSGIAAPGFHAPPDRTDAEIDDYALAVLGLQSLTSLPNLHVIDPHKIVDLLDLAERRFDLPPDYRQHVLDVLRPPTPGGQTLGVDFDRDCPDWPAIRSSIVRAILASATLDRTDRLFPGDIAQFADAGGLGMAYGAAGVLYALDSVGVRHEAYERWLIDAATRATDLPAGFYSGLHGVAYVLDRLGHRVPAVRLLARAEPLAAATDGGSLYDGLAGIGLTLLHFAGRTGDSSYLAQAGRIAEQIGAQVAAGRWPNERRTPNSAVDPHATDTPPASLMFGWSGIALFLLRMYEESHDTNWLDLAVRAVHLDLDRCVMTHDDTLQGNEGWRVRPYLDIGSAGVALVADELLVHRADDRIEASLAPLLRACEPEMMVFAGLWGGRAGLLAALCRLTARYPNLRPVVEQQLRGFAWHALRYQGELAFAGAMNLRLSMDLATGSAGVLLSLATAHDDEPAFLPYFRRVRPARNRSAHRGEVNPL
jgi:tRNA A-37 threonylcarbamoyl transferase component Bud32